MFSNASGCMLCQEMDIYKTRTDSMMTFPEESMPMLTLTGMPSHHRHVFLTAEVLVTMRPWRLKPRRSL